MEFILEFVRFCANNLLTFYRILWYSYLSNREVYIMERIFVVHTNDVEMHDSGLDMYYRELDTAIARLSDFYSEMMLISIDENNSHFYRCEFTAISGEVTTEFVSITERTLI